MEGGKLSDFSEKRYENVKQRTLGFQKVRTHDDRTKVKIGWAIGILLKLKAPTAKP